MEGKSTIQQFEDMTKKLIAQVVKESDLKAINPEMIKEVTGCLSTRAVV